MTHTEQIEDMLRRIDDVDNRMTYAYMEDPKALPTLEDEQLALIHQYVTLLLQGCGEEAA